MRSSKPAHAFRFGGAALAISLGLALSGCGGIPTNRSMYSVHQPVVEKVSYTLDVTTSGSGLAYGEQGRLAGWFGRFAGRFATLADRFGTLADRF